MPKLISIYSGCGGLDLGFEKAGFKTLLATDNWKPACDTLIQNKISQEVICDDIRNVDFKKYRNQAIDCLIGGPPCPPYSQTRHYLTTKSNGLKDEKSGFTLTEYFRTLAEVNPLFFLFENVDGFLHKLHSEELTFLQETSKNLGYNINYRVVNCANYGIPQTRKRFICIGWKSHLKDFIFPEETHKDPKLIKKQGEGNYKPWVTCGDILSEIDVDLPEDENKRAGSKDKDLLTLIPPGDNYLFFTEKRGHPNPIFKWKSRYWTFLLKLSPDRPSWTIQASFSNNQGPFHWKNRFLRISELKRIQTFDDNYNLTGNFQEQWRQIGNAVPPKLGYIFAKAIISQYFKE